MAINIRSILILLQIVSSIYLQAQDAGPKLNQKQIGVLVDSVSKALNRWYIFPDKAALVEKALKANYKKGVYNNANTSQELTMFLNTDIQATHKDKHLAVRYNPQMEKHLITSTPDSIIKMEEEMMLQDDRARNFDFIKVEKLPGNIGYIRWDGFAGNLPEVTPIMDGAFRFVANTKALIIDMRYNGGGSPETVLAMENYFFDKKIPMTHIISFKKDTLKQYIDPNKTTFKLRMPVYILTGKWTFSGAEDFTYGMKHSKRAIVVGDTSGGGAHPTDGFLVGQGFIANVPVARSYSEYTKTDWEGTGVYPDIAIKEGEALSKAKSLIYKDMMEKAGNTEEKNLYRWFMYSAENKELLTKQQFTDSVLYSKEQLKQFCGEYQNKKQNSSVAILLKGNSLYIDFLSTKDPDLRLIPVGKNRFAYNEDIGRALDFVIDTNGKIIGITNIRTNGINDFEKVK